MKDFIDDIKSGFDTLPNILSIAIFMGLLGAIFFGIDGGIYFIVSIVGIWAVVFILLPFAVLILDGINYILDPKKSKKK